MLFRSIDGIAREIHEISESAVAVDALSEKNNEAIRSVEALIARYNLGPTA